MSRGRRMDSILSSNLMLERPQLGTEFPRVYQLAYTQPSTPIPHHDDMLAPGLVSAHYGIRTTAYGRAAMDNKVIARVVFQRPPHRRTVHISDRPKAYVNEDNTRSFDLLLPWTLYVVGYEMNTRVFAMERPFSDDEPLYTLRMPNFYRNGLVCQNNELARLTMDAETSINQFMIDTYTGIWAGGFNMDTAELLSDLNLPIIGDPQRYDIFPFYERWEASTSLEEIYNTYLFSDRAYDNIDNNTFTPTGIVLDGNRSLFEQF